MASGGLAGARSEAKDRPLAGRHLVVMPTRPPAAATASSVSRRPPGLLAERRFGRRDQSAKLVGWLCQRYDAML